MQNDGAAQKNGPSRSLIDTFMFNLDNKNSHTTYDLN